MPSDARSLVDPDVPTSDVPGEWTSPTQPFPTKPAAYDRQGVSVDDLVDFMVGKALDHLGVEHRLLSRWGETAPVPGTAA